MDKITKNETYIWKALCFKLFLTRQFPFFCQEIQRLYYKTVNLEKTAKMLFMMNLTECLNIKCFVHWCKRFVKSFDNSELQVNPGVLQTNSQTKRHISSWITFENNQTRTESQQKQTKSDPKPTTLSGLVRFGSGTLKWFWINFRVSLLIFLFWLTVMIIDTDWNKSLRFVSVCLSLIIETQIVRKQTSSI